MIRLAVGSRVPRDRMLSRRLGGSLGGIRGLSPQGALAQLPWHHPEKIMFRSYASAMILQQVVAKLVCVPWGHHCIIIDKCKGDHPMPHYARTTKHQPRTTNICYTTRRKQEKDSR